MARRRFFSPRGISQNPWQKSAYIIAAVAESFAIANKKAADHSAAFRERNWFLFGLAAETHADRREGAIETLIDGVSRIEAVIDGVEKEVSPVPQTDLRIGKF